MLEKKKNNLVSENSDKPISKNSSHYVSNPDLYNEFVMWKSAKIEAQENDKPEPRIPENIGKGILQIAKNFSTKANWLSNSRYREEMVGDAVINCIKYVDRFDPDNFKNPFAYFTQICYFSFLRTIEIEKKSDYIKHKSNLNSVIFQEIQNGTFEDEDFVLEESDYDTANVDDFISSFELKNFGKKLDDNEIGGMAGKTKRIESKDEVGFL